MDCPAIGLPVPFDFSAPHDLWGMALLPLNILIFGGVFFYLKRFWERRFHRYPAKQPAPFFRWGIRISEALSIFGILILSIATLWLDALYHIENNTLLWGLDCLDAFQQAQGPVILYAWIGWGIGLFLCLLSIGLLHSAISSRHYIIVQP